MFPKIFEKNLRQQIGDHEWEQLRTALEAPAPVSIRLNPLKRPLDPALLPAEDGRVPWHPEAYYLPQRPVFTTDPLFQAGAYYVQEASSMFLHEALRQTGRLGKPLKVLDLCAAPGGKTTLLYDAVEASLTANEIVPNRAAILRENLEKWGVPNAAVTCADPAAYEGLAEWFDLVVVDAPCSGEGMFRKDPDAIKEWSPENVEICVARQSRILDIAKTVLAPGGLLLYSTCTYNPHENENQMKAALGTDANYRHIPLEINGFEGIVTCEPGLRFMPHRVRGEGFYLAVFEKLDHGARPPKLHAAAAFKHLTALPKRLHATIAPWLADAAAYGFWQTPTGEVLALPLAREAEMLLLDRHIKSKWFGLHVGTLKGNDLIPSHTLATSLGTSPSLPALELTREQALTYLKKETFELPASAPKGWTIMRYSGLPLGWAKVLPNRMNNYLPGERRIRMEV
jgi:16S rRNA C967 or C1407 C5-methylase (RsmB/RsmF family)/NOL1/NOP2/fmu family ribosome biogenesis protein